VGDGNFHFGYLIDPDNADERHRRSAEPQAGAPRHCHGRHLHRRARHRHPQAGLSARGSGDGAIAMMAAIKQALDPKNILNPGKIFTL
jgi:D-lactate dehydrogenase (cytochrome)